jgi:hypothetical protein
LHDLAEISGHTAPTIELPYFVAWMAGAVGTAVAGITGKPPRVPGRRFGSPMRRLPGTWATLPGQRERQCWKPSIGLRVDRLHEGQSCPAFRSFRPPRSRALGCALG